MQRFTSLYCLHMNLWTSTSNEFLIHGEVLSRKTTVGICKISCSGFALSFFPLCVTYCKIFIRWRRLLRSNYCLSFFIHPRYKDLLGNLPQDVKDDRYCTIVLNRIAGYGSVSITLCNYKSPNFRLVKHGFDTPILLHCLAWLEAS